jgi:drug/metabolite transporter (DMT)-like permease
MFPHFASVGFSLAAVLCWGTSDFIGGYAARRANAFRLTTIAHASGALLMITLALLNHSEVLSKTGVLWALMAGLVGGGALAIFYRALAAGKMGLTAPVSAVLGAAIPTAFGMISEGLPGGVQIAGFAFAVAGIWLISRSEDDHRPEGLGLAALAGMGFAGFFLCIKQAGNGSGSALWIAAASRSASFGLTGAIVLLGRNFRITPPNALLGILAGCLDVSGSALFIRASQTGRLDAAVVISSLYPVITVLLARLFLKEHFTPWKAVGMFAALLAVPLIAMQ